MAVHPLIWGRKIPLMMFCNEPLLVTKLSGNMHGFLEDTLLSIQSVENALDCISEHLGNLNFQAQIVITKMIKYHCLTYETCGHRAIPFTLLAAEQCVPSH